MTDSDELSLAVAHQLRWADDGIANILPGTNETSRGYLRGYRDALLLVAGVLKKQVIRKRGASNTQA